MSKCSLFKEIPAQQKHSSLQFPVQTTLKICNLSRFNANLVPITTSLLLNGSNWPQPCGKIQIFHHQHDVEGQTAQQSLILFWIIEKKRQNLSIFVRNNSKTNYLTRFTRERILLISYAYNHEQCAFFTEERLDI